MSTFANRRSRCKELGKKVPQAYRVYVEDTFLPCDAVGARIFSKEEDVYGIDYGFGLDAPKETEQTNPQDLFAYRRNYTWNERNLLTKSSDKNYTVHYRYGEDGQRALKYTDEGRSETLYFNNFFTIHIPTQDQNNPQGLRVHKHIFVGNSRLVTAMTHTDNSGDNEEQKAKRYYYHSDHLGSAQFVTDWKGRQYEHIEYTPYGELWIEEVAAGLDKLPFRFTGKELDEETGLYYYGARYLDPKYSRWLSGDPALGEYIPQAPIDDEAKKHNENLPGLGGVYNTVNLHVYYYAGNNRVKYVDPDGRVPWLAIPIIIGFTLLLQSDSQPSQRQGLPYEPDKWNSNLDIMVRTNCYAYAMNFQKNPVTGKSFPKRGEGGFALQPGDLFGYKLKDLQPSTIEFLVSLDCIKINYTFKETTFEKSVKKGNWKIALVIRSDDYHWYRQNEDGSWSHKQGSTPVKDTDDAGNKIFDPREAKSSYKFVKFYEVGPND